MKYKLELDENNYLVGFVHTETSEDTFELDPNSMDLGHLNCYKLLDDNTLYFDQEKADETDRKKEEELEEYQLKQDKMAMLADMMIITREPSDKLGYDWKVYTLGEVLLRKEYVPSEGHAGTAEDPIPFELGLTLIPNAFYTFDGHRYVYMGQGGVVAEDYPVDEVNGWVLFDE